MNLEVTNLLAIKVIKESFINLYDQVFKYIMISLSCMILFTLPSLLVYFGNSIYILIIGIIYLLVFAGPIILSGMNYIYKTIEREYLTIKDFFLGIKTNFKRGIISFLFPAAVYFILIMDIIFFSQRSENYLMLLISIFFFYLFIFFSIMQIYYWGLLTLEKDEDLRIIIKRSFLLTIDNIFPSLLIFIMLIIILVLNVVLAFIAPLFLFSLVSIIVILMTSNILKKYETK